MRNEQSRRDFIKGVAVSTIGISALGVLSGCGASGNQTQDSEASESDWMVQLTSWRSKPEEPTQFAREFAVDIVVVGAGFSGLNACRSACESGSSVICLEKDETYDVHGFDVAVINSKMARDVGVPEIDPTEFFLEYTRQHAMRVNNDLIRTYIKESGPALDDM